MQSTLQDNILYAEQEDTVTIEPIHYTWAWNVSAIFPDVPVSQVFATMQSLHDYSLHVVEASDIIHHLKFDNFNANILDSITKLFTNPLNYVSLILGSLAVCVALYFLYQCYCKQSRYQAPQPSAPPMPLHFIYPQL